VNRMENDLYELSGNTGSLRYMAPEVALGKPYNASVDIYSFGIILWQICALETPFSGYNVALHREKVILGGYRPEKRSTWSSDLCSLMDDCWSNNIRQRAEFSKIQEVIRDIISAILDDTQVDVLGVSNKTEKSL